MTLDENQKREVARWLEEGLKLAEIQTRLASEMGVKLTYMEVRFLVDDLHLTPKDPDPPEVETPLASPEEDLGDPIPLPAAEQAPVPAPEPPVGGGVQVSVDALTKPGSLASGQVTFSDGNQAEWYLDQMGRLGLAPKTEGYRPSPGDIQEFQVALEQEIRRSGL